MARNANACAAVELKQWKNLNYPVWDTMVQMQSLEEFTSFCVVHFIKVAHCNPENLFELSTCKIARIPYSIPETDLQLLQCLWWIFS